MERAPEIEELVRAWFAAASSGDPSVIDTHVSTDPATRLVGSDPSEWLSGGGQIAAFLRGEVTNAGGAAKFTPTDTEAYKDGAVGWAATRLTIRLPDGAAVHPRWTAVFHKEGDVWKFVQTHASIGIANEDAGWKYEAD